MFGRYTPEEEAQMQAHKEECYARWFEHRTEKLAKWIDDALTRWDRDARIVSMKKNEPESIRAEVMSILIRKKREEMKWEE